MNNLKLTDELYANDLLSKAYNEVQKLVKCFKRYSDHLKCPGWTVEYAKLLEKVIKEIELDSIRYYNRYEFRRLS